jgi:hypothetical protein
MACKKRTYSGGFDNVISKIISFLLGKGFTIEQACAVCGNIFQESGYNPSAINRSSHASGLCQWMSSRETRLRNAAKKTGKAWNDVDFQLDFLWEELNGTENATLRWFQSNKSEKNLDILTKKWTRLFERCGESENCYKNRIPEAKRCYNLYKNGGDAKFNFDTNYSSNLDADNASNNNGLITDNSEALIDCDNFTINRQVNEDNGSGNGDSGNSDGGSNSGSGGFSGTVTNPKMKKVLSQIEYFKNRGSAIPGCPSGAMCPLRGHRYWGKCTYGPTTFYANAGIALHFWCGVYGACRKRDSGYPLFPTFNCIKKTMDRYGFYLAGHWDFDEARALPTSTFRPGDVATLAGSPCGAHGLMWTGQDWRSDVIEKNICSAYPNQHKGKFGNYSVCIWRRRDCQEPGKENDKELPCTIC